MPKMNVESFNLDHTKVAAPYVRLAGTKKVKMVMLFESMMYVSNNRISRL